MQALLSIFGVASMPSSSFSIYINQLIPSFFLSLYGVLTIFIIVGTLRGLFVWMQAYLNGLSNVMFETKSKARIVSWAFDAKGARLSDVANLFNEKATGAASFIASFINGLTRIILSILLLFALFKLSVKLTAVCLILLIIIALPLKIIGRKIASESEALHFSLDNSLEKLIVGVRNLLFLHISGVKNKEKVASLNFLQNYYRAYKKYFFFSGMKSAIPQIFGIYLVCTIAYLTQSGNYLQTGALVQYFYLFLRFIQALAELANLASYLSLTLPRIKNLYDWYEKDFVATFTDANDLATSDRFEGPLGISVKNMSFSYSVDMPPVLKNVEFYINPSEILVITGESGAGKTTLMHILVGLIKGYTGKVTLFNEIENLENWNQNKLLNSIGYVGPEPFIISGTIKDNLLYANNRRDISLGEIKKATTLSNCNFIYDLPHKLDHKLTEHGEGLSAGQKQRLTIARALLRKPSILLLDEATSNLDESSENLIINSLNEIKKTMTIICITHRKGLLRVANQHLNLEKYNKTNEIV